MFLTSFFDFYDRLAYYFKIDTGRAKDFANPPQSNEWAQNVKHWYCKCFVFLHFSLLYYIERQIFFAKAVDRMSKINWEYIEKSRKKCLNSANAKNFSTREGEVATYILGKNACKKLILPDLIVTNVYNDLQV